MSLPVAANVWWEAMKGDNPVVVYGQVVESQFSKSDSNWSLCRILNTNTLVEIKDENLTIIDQICAGCFARVRPGISGDHLNRCPTGQNGTPDNS